MQTTEYICVVYIVSFLKCSYAVIIKGKLGIQTSRSKLITCACITDGLPDGYCSVNILCLDANSACSNGICECNSGYRTIDRDCRKGKEIMVKLAY